MKRFVVALICALVVICPSFARADWVDYAQEFVTPSYPIMYWNYYFAEMVVPPLPAHNGQSIAFWGGILGAKCLLQPALTFDDISNQPKHDWQLRAEYICGNNPEVVGGTVNVSPGDFVSFSITLTSVLHNQTYRCSNGQRLTGDSWAWTLQAMDDNTGQSAALAATFGPCDGNNVGAQILFPEVQEKRSYTHCPGTGGDPINTSFFDVYMGATTTPGIPYVNTEPLVPLTTFPVPGPYAQFLSQVTQTNLSCFYGGGVTTSGAPGSLWLQ